MSDALPRATPESQGIPSAALLDTLDRLEKQEIHSLMVVRHGKVVAEGWWAPYAKNRVHQLFSLSKSFCSTAVGLAVAENRLTLNDRVLSFFPEFTPANPSENLRQMRVRDLLTMTTGHESEPWEGGPDFRRGFLAYPVPKEPGNHFLYNSLATYMCSAIVQKLTGTTVSEYLKPRLFEPLGIDRHPWEKDGNGIDFGGWGLSVTTEDIAKFGQLYLQNGVWEGRRLLPSTWVGQATAKQVRNGDETARNDWAQGYGFQFWRCQTDCARGDGAFGQLCIVIPRLDMVIAVTASVDDIQAELSAFWEGLLPQVAEKPLRASRAHGRLVSRLAGLSLPAVSGVTSANAALAGRYSLEDALIRDVHLELSAESAHLEVSGEMSGSILAGFGRWLEGSFGAETVAACAAWQADGSLTVRIRWIERTLGQEWNLRRVNEKLVLKRTQRGALGLPPPPADVTGIRR